MIDSFYTLRALTEAWQPRLEGAVLADAFSQEPGELVLAFEKANAGPGEGTAHPKGTCPSGRAQSVRIGVERPLLFAFRSEGASKARRNVATLFERAHGRRVETVRIARRDRQLFFHLEGGAFFQVPLFGARANVFLVEEVEGEAGRIVEAFRGSEEHAGAPPPEPQPAPMPDDFAAFEARWRPGRNTLAQAVSAAMTLFGPTLAAEAVFRAGVETGDPAGCSEAERRRLFEAAQALREALHSPAPRIYAEGWEAGTFALIELRHRAGGEAEPFETVDEAARVYVRRRLAERRYAELKAPLEDALTSAVERQQRTVQSLEGQLQGTPRADRYERFGHLLKAQPHQVKAGASEAVLPDYFAEAAPGQAAGQEPPTRRIPLKPELTAMENADRYYEKARGARTARKKAEERLADARRELRRARRLLDQLRAAGTLKAMRRFRREREEELAAYTAGREGGGEEPSFRRFRLKGGYEILAGKNARQNHELTFHHAQKYDLWLHARRVPGAHVVLRLSSRDAAPSRRAVQAAAGVAAYYSKARTSKLVPVMVTERKYVRSPSGAPPGAVRVEHEEVVMAEPRLPD